mgnify:CR=1 FL=1
MHAGRGVYLPVRTLGLKVFRGRTGRRAYSCRANQMATTASHSKSLGTTLETWLIDWYDSLRSVGDPEATWHDAETTAAWYPSGITPFCGICVIERGTPVEIKACAREGSNGPDRDSPGHWYIKKDAHDRLLEAAGSYLLAVHDGPDAVLARRVIPASLLDEFLKDRWYRSGRSEGVVCQLSWPRLIDSL